MTIIFDFLFVHVVILCVGIFVFAHFLKRRELGRVVVTLTVILAAAYFWFIDIATFALPSEPRREGVPRDGDR